PVAELRGTIHGATVRIAHLLSHTSGYRGTHLLDPAMRELDWTGLIALLRAAPQLFPPGTVFSYEHTEAVLLGRILERATGREPLEYKPEEDRKSKRLNSNHVKISYDGICLSNKLKRTNQQIP